MAVFDNLAKASKAILSRSPAGVEVRERFDPTFCFRLVMGVALARYSLNHASVVSQKKLYSGASLSGPLLLESSACPTVNVF